jgi:hypothetical protein
MTKLVVVLAVVIVVILVVVIVAVRNMRAEDPDEFADRPGGRGGMRDSRNGRDPRYDRREPDGRNSARGGRPAARPSGNGSRSAGARGVDERADHRGRGYDRQPEDGRGYDDDRRVGQQRGHDDRRGAQPASAREGRRVNGTQRRPEESQPPARTRSARGRRSDDSSQWDSSEWDKLSDVDYWAELASDKSLTITGQSAPPPATQRPAAQARNGRPRPDREADAPVGRSNGPAASVPGGAMPNGQLPNGAVPNGAVPNGAVPNGAPRRDPVTGLPVRGRGQPVNGDLAATVRRAAEFAAAPVPLNGTQDQLGPLSDPHLSMPRHGGPASLPRPVHGIQQDLPASLPAPLDDDPLTSPSFPRVPASDSRSYRNGRSSTPPQGSRVPEQYLAPTQQFSSYGAPTPQPPAAPQRQAPQGPAAPRHTGPQHQATPRPAAPQRPAAQRHADVGGETQRTNPNAYRPDPLTSRDPYAARSASLPPTPIPPAPAPSAPTTAGNPYGSYVTPDSPAPAAGYGDYPAASGNGHGPYLPTGNGGAHAGNGGAHAGNGGAHAGNGYWQGQAPGTYSGAGGSDYLNGSAPVSDPRDADPQAAEYGNGYGPHDQAGYPPNGYPAGPHDPAGYAAADPYGREEYGGYPGYGAGGR